MKTLLAALLLIAPVSLTAAAQTFSDQTSSRIQTFLKDTFADHHGAIVIGILDRDGSRTFSAGKMDNETDRPADADTFFELGSVTKVFTVLLANELEQRGRWKLSDPIAGYLPRKVKAPAFTIENLCAQESGMPRFPHNYTDQAAGRMTITEIREAANAYSIANLYDYLSNYTPTNKPGESFAYSNTGIALLGHLTERREEVNFASLLKSRVLSQLNMADTAVELLPWQKRRLATGHWQDGRKSENLEFKAMAPAGLLFTTANDLLKFMSAVLSFTGPRFAPLFERMSEIRHTDSPRYGRTAMPWMDQHTYNPPGSELLGHGGGGFGYIAFIGYDKMKRRAVVVLSSQMVWNPPRIGWAILQDVPLTPENINFGVRQLMGVGIGIRKDDQSGKFSAGRVFPHSPAGMAGIQAGSIIHKISGTAIAGKTLNECLDLLRGEEGSSVDISFIAPDSDHPKSYELQRRKFITSSE